MAIKKKNIILRIFFSALLLIVIAVACLVTWVSHNYKRMIMERLPAMVMKSSDSVYHMTLKDISIDFLSGKATITGLSIWPDKTQVMALRARRHHVPTTLSTVYLPLAEINDISWSHLLFSRSLDCGDVSVHELKWVMEADPHPGDTLFTRDKPGKPAIVRVTAAHGHVLSPDVTYKYEGTSVHFSAEIKGGTGVLNSFVYDTDEKKDTSNFLYANSGSVRPDSFIFTKQGSRYNAKKPGLDFETGPNTITLKSVKADHLADVNEASGKIQELYNLAFPRIEITSMNWNMLINDGILHATAVKTSKALMDIHYISENEKPHSKTGDYPNQQLHEVGLKTDIREFYMTKSLFRYTEPSEKSGQEGVIELEDLDCHIANITNLADLIRKDNNCPVKIKAKYNHKSNLAGTINLTLGNADGHFTMEGYLENLDAADVTKQTQAFALFEVTSLHMSRIDVHEEGDATYVAGGLTMRYQDLKISVLKFEGDHRKSKRGPLSFLANALVLYPDNPMKGKDVRSVTTTFARDSTKGFVSMIWENILRGAKKTAIRSNALINLTDGPETTRGEKPKKGFFTRLFGKKHKQ